MRIRAPADDRHDSVEVADVVEGSYYRCDPDALAGAILAQGDADHGNGAAVGIPLPVPRDDQARAALTEGWKHWEARGWHPSDQYYIASRRWKFVDADDPTGSIRRATLASLLEREGPPAEPVRLEPRLPLDAPAPPSEETVASLLADRRTFRSYARRPVTQAALSGLLYYGLTGVRVRRQRTAPTSPLTYVEDSFGSIWDMYACVFDIEGTEPGVYRYEILDHRLAPVRSGDHREDMAAILQGMNSPRTAALTLVLIADFPRYQWRYRHEHGLRRIYLEAGIIAQELIILGCAYGLGTLVTPAQRDSDLLELVALPPGRYGPIYTLTMGPMPAPAPAPPGAGGPTGADGPA